MPPTRLAVVAPAAELVQLVPLPSPPARLASSFTVTEVGTTPVRVFTVRSLLTPRLTVWSGVTRQEQHEISSSPGSNAYTFTQMLPAAPRPGPFNEPPLAPVLVMFTYDSPMLRFDAYLT